VCGVAAQFKGRSSAGDTQFVQEMQHVLLDMVKNPTHPWQDIDQFEEE
jgi:hypothetical protein